MSKNQPSSFRDIRGWNQLLCGASEQLTCVSCVFLGHWYITVCLDCVILEAVYCLVKTLFGAVYILNKIWVNFQGLSVIFAVILQERSKVTTVYENLWNTHEINEISMHISWTNTSSENLGTWNDIYFIIINTCTVLLLGGI